ncbi:homocysteine S-methyltransferase family protein [Zoogloea sp.]|uniref:homocysteine S-methyltransferase family protein n=1 Tax=Zoogloea sp. TaxID=49181 RepID=UPI0035B06006|nr:homocysteine S-methyltransferase family protein [Rhodocyclales bacterium]
MSALMLLDGGTGRELARMGAPFRQPEWSALALIEAPHFVSQVHAAYVQAGADVITTNSYALVPFHIGEERFVAQAEALATLAGELAQGVKRQAGRPVAVAGSLPPSCGSYRPDLFRAEEGRRVLAPLVRGLRAQVDHWQAETLSAIEEAQLVRDVLGHDDKPLWLSFTLQDEGCADAQPRLRSGELVADAARAALALGARAMLFNCSQPEVMAAAVDVAVDFFRSQAAAVQVGVYANAFPPQPKDAEANSGLDEIRADLTPALYVNWARSWRARGADIIGGCCGIGPEHIEQLYKARMAGVL